MKSSVLLLTLSRRGLRQRGVPGRRGTAARGPGRLCPCVRASEPGGRPQHQAQLLLQRAGVPGPPTLHQLLPAHQRDL